MIAALPEELAGRRVLEIAAVGVLSVAPALAERDCEVVHSEQPDELPEGEMSFDLVLCRDVLRSIPYPLAFLARLWRLTAPGGVLLLEAETVPEAAHSHYAHFVPAAHTGAGWVPGRLALRWMVESAGFDVERWLELEGPANGARACLRARRAEREPARSAP